MAGIIGAIIIGVLIALAEKAMKGDSREGQKRAQSRVASVRPTQRQTPRPPRRKPAPVAEAPAEVAKPFLQPQEEGVRVTVADTQPMTQVSRPVFTKSQQELRRTIILGEILRRKF